MNKMIWIALSVLLLVGVSYQAKRTYDAHHAGLGNASTGNTTAQNGDALKNPDGTLATTPNGANGTQASDGTRGANTAQTAGANGASSTTSGTSNTTGVGGTNGIGASGPANSAGEKGAVTKTEPEKPKDNCFAFEYRHKKEAQNQDIENFLDFTNAFPIARADYNPKSLCVKVNQKAVNFNLAKSKTGTEVRVGSMVGPESVIRVSYCVGKVSPCHETCVQPKKRFMDDLMNDAGDEDAFTDSWGKDGDDKNKKELKEKSKELRTIASENDHLNEASIQRDWDELQKQEWVCK